MSITENNKKNIELQIDFLAKEIVKKNTNLELNNFKLSKIIKTYEQFRDNIKAFMKKEHETQIDRHKIAVMISLSILKEKPIEIINDKAELSEKTRNANIYLTLYVSQAIIRDFYYQENQIKLKMSLPDKNYIFEYVKLIYNNMEHLSKICSNNKDELANILFFMSHLFYFFENYSIIYNQQSEKPKE
ncbi:hypothetical protein ACOTVM_00925 [Aliarcobacter butzleri]